MVEYAANKIASFVLIVVFVALGIVGILLPIIPGIPFLLIAAVMASRHIPALAHYLEQNRHTAKSMRLSKRFSHLDFWGKVQFCCWGCLKFTVDTADWFVSVFAKLWRRQQ